MGELSTGPMKEMKQISKKLPPFAKYILPEYCYLIRPRFERQPHNPLIPVRVDVANEQPAALDRISSIY